MSKKTMFYIGSILIMLSVCVWSVVRTQSSEMTLRLQQGLGAEVSLPQTASAVGAALDSINSFTTNRSGITINLNTKNRLAQMERDTLNGVVNKLTVAQVQAVFTDQFFETVATLTDTDIKTIADRSAVTPDWNSAPRTMQVQLRSTGKSVNKSIWFDKATAYRDSSTPEAVAQRIATPGLIANEVQSRMNLYKVSSPSQWGNSTYTPIQVYLLHYSLVTDDLMEGSQNYLQSQIQGAENFLYTHYNVPRSSAGRKAYGLNGYLYSSSTDLFLSDQVINRILDRVSALNH